jgi:hypothetical protein
MSSQNGNGAVPPFIDEEAERKKAQTQQQRSSLFVMGLGWMGLTVAMLGVAKVLLDYFLFTPPATQTGDTANGGLIRFAQVSILAFMYAVGWVISLISIRRLYNQILPVLVRIYSFFVVAGILFVYGHAVVKIFMEADLSASRHFVVLIVGYIALISLHLLVEESDLVIMVFPLMLAGFAHLLVAVFHYVFTNPQKPEMVWIDLSFIIFMILLIVLLSAQGLYKPMKNLIKQMTSP